MFMPNGIPTICTLSQVLKFNYRARLHEVSYFIIPFSGMVNGNTKTNRVTYVKQR